MNSERSLQRIWLAAAGVIGVAIMLLVVVRVVSQLLYQDHVFASVVPDSNRAALFDVPTAVGCYSVTTGAVDTPGEASEIESIRSFLPNSVALANEPFINDDNYLVRPTLLAKRADVSPPVRWNGRAVRAYWRPAARDRIVIFVGPGWFYGTRLILTSRTGGFSGVAALVTDAGGSPMKVLIPVELRRDACGKPDVLPAAPSSRARKGG